MPGIGAFLRKDENAGPISAIKMYIIDNKHGLIKAPEN